MPGDNSNEPDHKPKRSHDRIVMIAVLTLGGLLVIVGHLSATEVVTVLAALGALCRELLG